MHVCGVFFVLRFSIGSFPPPIPSPPFSLPVPFLFLRIHSRFGFERSRATELVAGWLLLWSHGRVLYYCVALKTISNF